MALAGPDAGVTRGASGRADGLRARAHELMSQLGALTRRLAPPESSEATSPTPSGPPPAPALPPEGGFVWRVATVDAERCTCCGQCVDVCPQQAIRLEDSVTIDAALCTACGGCAFACPIGAITLTIAAP